MKKILLLLFCCSFLFAEQTKDTVQVTDTVVVVEIETDTNEIQSIDSVETEKDVDSFIDTIETIKSVDTVENDTILFSKEIQTVSVPKPQKVVAVRIVDENISDDAAGEKASTINFIPLLFIVILFGLIVLVIVFLLKRKQNSGNFLTSTRISIMDREVQLVCQYIEEHYSETDLNVDSVCTALSTGKPFVEALFEKELDMTLNDFIIHVRIHRAVNRINDGFSGNVEELMQLSGYREMEQFDADFLSVAGVKLNSLITK